MKTLRLWVLPDGGLETVPALRRPLTSFGREFPGVRIETTVRTSGTLWTNLMRWLKRPDQSDDGRSRPDVIEIPSYWTSALAYLGLLEDLSDLGSVNLDRWLPELRTHAVLEGTSRIFSLPWWMEVRVLYYRDDLLRRFGLEGSRDLADWDGLRRACRRMAARRRSEPDVIPLANPNPRESLSLSDVASAIWSRRGDFLSEDGSHCLFHREELVEGMRAYVELLSRGWMPLSGKEGAVSDDFFDGRCALRFSGRFPRRMPPKASSALRAVELPGASARVGLVSSHHLAVLRGTEMPREAFGMARHLCESAAGYAEALGGFSCTPAWREESFESRPDLKEVFRRAFDGARLLPNKAVIGSLERIFERNMERLLRSILQETYQEQTLREELLYAKAEMDYVLSMPLEVKA